MCHKPNEIKGNALNSISHKRKYEIIKRVFFYYFLTHISKRDPLISNKRESGIIYF